MESPEATIAAAEPIEIYVFYTTVEAADLRHFKLHDLQGQFVTNHKFQPGDAVKLTVEKLPDANIKN